MNHPIDRSRDAEYVQILPSPRQLALQETEFYAFVHFTVNAFTDREWGDSANYHINLDSGYLGEMVCVDIITSVARRMDSQK